METTSASMPKSSLKTSIFSIFPKVSIFCLFLVDFFSFFHRIFSKSDFWMNRYSKCGLWYISEGRPIPYWVRASLRAHRKIIFWTLVPSKVSSFTIRNLKKNRFLSWFLSDFLAHRSARQAIYEIDCPKL